MYLGKRFIWSRTELRSFRLCFPCFPRLSMHVLSGRKFFSTTRLKRPFEICNTLRKNSLHTIMSPLDDVFNILSKFLVCFCLEAYRQHAIDCGPFSLPLCTLTRKRLALYDRLTPKTYHDTPSRLLV